MDRIALVTGAGSGIGQACAGALLAEGWQVVYAGRRLDRLQAAIAATGEHAARASAVACDVADEASVAALFDTVRSRHGRLDLLFNNAGAFPPAATPDELGGAAWRQAVDVNLNGAFYCLAAAFALMRSQQPMGGRIINNGSISAHAPRPGSIAYTATKHAITGLTRAAALDGRAFDIAVGQIDIGNVETDMTERMARGVTQADGSLRAEPRMAMDGVVETFLAMARLPLSANVLFTTVMATKMPFVGRG
ncbi:SDR family oxidoreductase [Rubrivivax gelatinosus]|uniref:Dehydrogenase n=1 Tax=Rubrivivax gelatinosus (strain NBRC 100245 / IL144) TaxID=983917 RepID=I0HNT3_RUBGI|nr:SDR family oxidoreductase [Rubrivivax gelatinosus]BAL94670.1 dehydrogenase [Rubrivivax gelatinosus IL144]